jgi:hypothetical protein
VADASDADRQAFAVVALEEMAQVYIEEVDSAYPIGDDRAAWRWRSGAQAYARQLQGLAARIDRGTLIDIYVEPIDTVRLRIDDTQVMLTSPRIIDSTPFDERIVQRYCADNDCEVLRAAEAARPIASAAADDRRATWTFSDRGGTVLQTESGIHFAFADTVELQSRKRLCLDFVGELELLARHLQYHRGRGVPIDWNLLRIGADAPSGEQRVLLNRYGQSILLPLPILERARQGLEVVKPWLMAQADGRRVQMAPIPAQRLLAGLIVP